MANLARTQSNTLPRAHAQARSSSSSPNGSAASTSLSNLADDLAGTVLSGVIGVLVTVVGIQLGTRMANFFLDPMKKEKDLGKEAKRAWQARMARNGIKIATTEYENIILQDVIDPEEIDVDFSMIGGLEDQKKDIIEVAVLPLKRPDIFRSRGKLISPPKGLLLYGAPGTGKTMIAKAIAKESGATFINLKMSTIMNKWFGESQKLVRAVFSLAEKLAPSIIFIDEIDCFMRARGGEADTAVYNNMKAEFMTLWDGVGTKNTYNNHGFSVMVLGATNRPYDMDSAILRRMPRTFHINLPKTEDREKILRILLDGESLEKGFDIGLLALRTSGYSGSDLKELCQAAALLPLREFLDSTGDKSIDELSPDEIRCMRMDDFIKAMERVQPTGAAAQAFLEEESREKSSGQQERGFNANTPEALLALMMASLQQSARHFNPPPDSNGSQK